MTVRAYSKEYFYRRDLTSRPDLPLVGYRAGEMGSRSLVIWRVRDIQQRMEKAKRGGA